MLHLPSCLSYQALLPVANAQTTTQIIRAHAVMTVAVSARNPIRTSAHYAGPMVPVDLVSFIFTLIEIAFSFLADFHPRLYPLQLSYLKSWERERASISLVMLCAQQANFWYHFYNIFDTRSLTGYWTGTCPTRSQHSTTRLSRRRWNSYGLVSVDT